jgi:recombination protein RecT
MAKSNSSNLANKLEVRATAKSTGMTVYDLIEKQKPAIERALPNVGITAERISRVLMTQIRVNEKLANCTPASLLGAVMLTAQLGLEPGPLGQAYLVPFGNECQFIVGYKGLITLAYRSGGIVISAYEICQNDLFKHDYGTGQVQHTFPLQKDRGPTVGVWAKAVLATGQSSILVMTKAEVEEHRKRSRAKDSGPWITDYDAMAKKTVIRALCSQLPLSSEAQKAMAADETAVIFNKDEGVIDAAEAPIFIDVTDEAQVEVETE